jgi:predicted benzoate:H+ symporter BenE
VPPLCWWRRDALGGIAVLEARRPSPPPPAPRLASSTGLVLLGTALFGAYTLVLRPLAAELGGGTAAAYSTVVARSPTWRSPG